MLIEAGHILPALFTRVLIPPEVVAELQHPRTPALVRRWMQTPPSWLTIQAPRVPPDPTLSRLGPGERDALLLMQEGVAQLLVTDGRSAVRAARTRAIPVVRPLRVLEHAAERTLIDLPRTLTRLQAAGFYMPGATVVEELLARDAARKGQGAGAE